VPGVDYHFVSRREFKDRVAAGDMLEHAEFAGQWYGTPRSEVLHALAEGHTVVLEIELEGARQVKAAVPEALTVFIEPPSMVELAARLRSRGTEDAEEVDRRLRTAEREIAHAHEFQAILVNTDVEDTAKALLHFIDVSAP
jgi:guanylate kinase